MQQKHGSGPNHGKSKNKMSKDRRAWSWARCQARKDRHVEQSSKGKFTTVAALETHRRKVSH